MLNSLILLCAANSPIAVADADRVLVVMNKSSEASREIGRYYVQQRKIPHDHVILIDCPDKETMMPADYQAMIETPVRAKAKALKVDFIVLTKGVPLRLQNGAGFSVDSMLATMEKPLSMDEMTTPEKQQPKNTNPYFQKDEPFSAKKFGLYLVTRLDAYTLADAKALVDRSLAAKPEKGPFFFDAMKLPANHGYAEMNDTLIAAGKALSTKGLQAETQTDPSFAGPSDPLAGYASWGSNDSAFDMGKYHALKFKPGALVETFVSTSGRTFNPTVGGQSLIADLIAQGATGIKGYVSEPYTVALARPNILFDRYTKGFNLAESFYMASPLIKWKDVVIGDPLCSPYKKK